MVRDPVCGMTIDEMAAPAQYTYKGQTYYFCSSACRERFQASPEDYLTPDRGERAKEIYENLKLLVRQFTPFPPGREELTYAELFALEVLGQGGRLMMSKLALECGLSLSTMTGVVDRLVKRGLVRRERTEEDRRVVLVELSEEGQRAYQERLEGEMRLIINLMEALDREEQESLLEHLRKIRGRLGDAE